MGHAQVIGIISCRFPNCSIIYPVVPVYYFPGQPSNTISSGAIKFYVSFQNVTSEPLEHFDFVEPQRSSWKSPYQTQGELDELNRHQNSRRKSKVSISLCIRNSYHRTYLEDICSRFDQVRPVFLHLEVRLPKKPPPPNNIDEG